MAGIPAPIRGSCRLIQRGTATGPRWSSQDTAQNRPLSMEKGQCGVNTRDPEAGNKADIQRVGMPQDCPYFNSVTAYIFTAPPAEGAVLTSSGAHTSRCSQVLWAGHCDRREASGHRKDTRQEAGPIIPTFIRGRKGVTWCSLGTPTGPWEGFRNESICDHEVLASTQGGTPSSLDSRILLEWPRMPPTQYPLGSRLHDHAITCPDMPQHDTPRKLPCRALCGQERSARACWHPRGSWLESDCPPIHLRSVGPRRQLLPLE